MTAVKRPAWSPRRAKRLIRRMTRRWSPRRAAKRIRRAVRRWSPKRVAARLIRRVVVRWSPRRAAKRGVKRLVRRVDRLASPSTVRVAHRGPLTHALRMFRKQEVALTWKELAERLRELMPEVYRMVSPATVRSLLGAEGVRSRPVPDGTGCRRIDIEQAIQNQGGRPTRRAQGG